MNNFLTATPVSVTLDLVTAEGELIEATAGTYTVKDETGNVIVVPTATEDPTGASELLITIPAISNTLTAGVPQGLRVIYLTLTTAIGTVQLKHSYLIEAAEPLIAGLNSFVTLTQAEFIAAGSMPSCNAWNAATPSQRVAAMIQARLNISLLRYRPYWADPMSHLSPWMAQSDLTLLSITEWLALDASMVMALSRAQVYEADDILGGDPITKKRESGLLLEKVGESTMQFRPGMVIAPVVCARAMREISKYVDRQIRTTRT